MVIVNVTSRSVLTAIAGVLVFVVIFVVGFYLTYGSYPDARLWQSYVGVVSLLGGVPVVIQLFRLGLIFLAGASAGWIADCVISTRMDPLQPTMQAGLYNLFIVVACAAVAIMVELVHQLRDKRNSQPGDLTS